MLGLLFRASILTAKASRFSASGVHGAGVPCQGQRHHMVSSVDKAALFVQYVKGI